MEVTGEYQIDAPRQAVWDALNDPEMLRKCIPGCESLEQVGENAFEAKVTAAIGPVKASFNTSLALEDQDPPASYKLSGKSRAAAGFGSGSATVTLAEADGGTLLSYVADFKVGGKLAQVGSRLVLGATRKIADDFFRAFSEEIDPGSGAAEAATDVIPARTSSRTWMAVGAAVVVLLLWFFLLR